MATFTSSTTIKGDPLSPLQFNMEIDELLESLNSNFSGGSLPNGAKCADMAFADNIIILSDHEVEVPLMLGIVEEFLREGRMGVNPAKCHWHCCRPNGLEQATEDPASRAWILEKPQGWSGKGFVHAVQLRTANLPTKAIPSTPKDQRRCRGGCVIDESISHVFQTCRITHWERIRRHNKSLTKSLAIARSEGGVLKTNPMYATELSHLLVIADVQVSWDSPELGVSYDRKRRKYDNPCFREAATTRWPVKSMCSPLLLWAPGASGPGSITKAPMFSGYPPRYPVLA
nr:hypothetical protein GEV33_014511 [Tenebrio molitor]